jgi:glycosyltransferase involved in cell wall biosynthesis
VRLVVLPTLRTKYTDTVVHTLLSVLHALGQRFEGVLICNAANALFAAVPRLAGSKVAVNVDGIERKRRKWNRLGRLYYRLSERLVTRLPHAIVADARVIERYYQQAYGAPSVFIPYGAGLERAEPGPVLERLGLAPDGYFLFVSRLEPENNAHRVLAAFERVRTGRRLVLVGDAPYARDYIRSLHAATDPRVILPGGIYGAGYRELQSNAFCYIHATEVGGTHPALVEAMGLGGLVVANDTPENVEALGGAGLVYRFNDVEDLARVLQEVEDEPERHAPLRAAARARAAAEYSWDAVVARYEALFTGLLAGTGPARML